MKPLRVLEPNALSADERAHLQAAGFEVACGHRFVSTVAWNNEHGRVTECRCGDCDALVQYADSGGANASRQ